VTIGPDELHGIPSDRDDSGDRDLVERRPAHDAQRGRLRDSRRRRYRLGGAARRPFMLTRRAGAGPSKLEQAEWRLVAVGPHDTERAAIRSQFEPARRRLSRIGRCHRDTRVSSPESARLCEITRWANPGKSRSLRSRSKPLARSNRIASSSVRKPACESLR